MSADQQHDEDNYFRFALDIVNKAGRLVKDAFAQPNSHVTTKASATDLVTETDQAVEEMLIKGLSAQFPTHKFIGEESAAAGKKSELTDAPTWIIDPIDGTTNFVHRIPLIAICVGLAINKKLRAGIVYNPITNELFTAQAGKGALKNGFPIHVSSTEALNKSVICTSLGIHNLVNKGDEWLDTALNNQKKTTKAGVRGGKLILVTERLIVVTERLIVVTEKLNVVTEKLILVTDCQGAVVVLQLGSDRSPSQMNSFNSNFNVLMGDKQIHGHRAFGSAAVNMVYVAQGSIDAYVEYGLHSWDIAAAAVILKEAGGFIIDPTGSEFNVLNRKVLCASTEKLARELSGLLTHVDFEPEG